MKQNKTKVSYCQCMRIPRTACHTWAARSILDIVSGLPSTLPKQIKSVLYTPNCHITLCSWWAGSQSTCGSNQECGHVPTPTPGGHWTVPISLRLPVGAFIFFSGLFYSLGFPGHGFTPPAQVFLYCFAKRAFQRTYLTTVTCLWKIPLEFPTAYRMNPSPHTWQTPVDLTWLSCWPPLCTASGEKLHFSEHSTPAHSHAPARLLPPECCSSPSWPGSVPLHGRNLSEREPIPSGLLQLPPSASSRQLL